MIDFQTEKDKRQIDEQYRILMPDGSRWYKFFAEYKAGEASNVGLDEATLTSLDRAGAVFPQDVMSVEFWARDFDHARMLVDKMREGLELKGQLYNEVMG